MRPSALVNFCSAIFLVSILVGCSPDPAAPIDLAEDPQMSASFARELEDNRIGKDRYDRAGYVEFMEPGLLAEIKSALPQVEDPEIQSVLDDPDTMFYDDDSMVFAYQDGVEIVVGLRANHVGYDVGFNNRGSVIGKLMNFFQPGKFKFPFATALGTDSDPEVHPVQFWLPPKVNGQALPVKWWKRSRRAHWHWVFPMGTIFGEVLFKKASDGQRYAFEVRIRQRYQDGWAVNVFRPFVTAASFADAIIAERPHWASDAELAGLVNHLRNPATLTPFTLRAEHFAPIFEEVRGSQDTLPAISDHALLKQFMRERTFVSAEGTVWKRSGSMETYAPTTQASFHIVPKSYTGGLIEVNEVSCNRCHQDTAREIGEFDFDIQLYGEIWGDDRIFTWHPFEDNRRIHATFDDADRSRVINPRLINAGLLEQVNGAPNEANYNELPRRYTYRFQ